MSLKQNNNSCVLTLFCINYNEWIEFMAKNRKRTAGDSSSNHNHSTANFFFLIFSALDRPKKSDRHEKSEISFMREERKCLKK